MDIFKEAREDFLLYSGDKATYRFGFMGEGDREKSLQENSYEEGLMQSNYTLANGIYATLSDPLDYDSWSV